MKNLFVTFLIMILLAGCSLKKQAEDPEVAKQAVETLISDYFKSIETWDWENLKAISTNNLILIEDGLIWNNDSLINNVENVWKDAELKFTIDFIRTDITENSAWIVYRNNGVAKLNNKVFDFNWVESGNFIKEGDKWKISFLHSTLQGKPRITGEEKY